MSKSNGTSTFSRAVAYILVILLIAGVIGAVVALTNGFQNDIPVFAVMYKDENVGNQSGVRLALGETSQFTVKTLTGEPQDLSVKVIADERHDFEFTVEGETKHFADEGDITDGFDIAVSADNVISITLSENTSIQTVLAQKYYGSEVVVPPDDITDVDYFRLLITTASGASVFVGFSFEEMNIVNPSPGSMVDSIILSESEVII